MKKILFLVATIAFTMNGFSQNRDLKVQTTREAQYPQGDFALDSLISKKIKYSDEAKAKHVSGEVMISFWVETDSTLSTFKIISDPGYGCGESVKAVLQNLKFTPSLVNGVLMRQKIIKTVPVYAY